MATVKKHANRDRSRGQAPRKRVFIICVNYNSWFSDDEYLGKNGQRTKEKSKAQRFIEKAALEWITKRNWPASAIIEI